MAETRETIMSGDWLLDDDDETYVAGFRCRVPATGDRRVDTWNGFAVPLVTRETLEAMVRFQREYAESLGQAETTDRWQVDESGALLVTSMPGTLDEETTVIRPVDGLYDVSLGYTWYEVTEADCGEVYG